jgi:hypothetical protein
VVRHRFLLAAGYTIVLDTLCPRKKWRMEKCLQAEGQKIKYQQPEPTNQNCNEGVANSKGDLGNGQRSQYQEQTGYAKIN